MNQKLSDSLSAKRSAVGSTQDPAQVWVRLGEDALGQKTNLSAHFELAWSAPDLKKLGQVQRSKYGSPLIRYTTDLVFTLDKGSADFRWAGEDYHLSGGEKQVISGVTGTRWVSEKVEKTYARLFDVSISKLSTDSKFTVKFDKLKFEFLPVNP